MSRLHVAGFSTVVADFPSDTGPTALDSHDVLIVLADAISPDVYGVPAVIGLPASCCWLTAFVSVTLFLFSFLLLLAFLLLREGHAIAIILDAVFCRCHWCC
jgi:hypothetical protein